MHVIISKSLSGDLQLIIQKNNFRPKIFEANYFLSAPLGSLIIISIQDGICRWSTVFVVSVCLNFRTSILESQLFVEEFRSFQLDGDIIGDVRNENGDQVL